MQNFHRAFHALERRIKQQKERGESVDILAALCIDKLDASWEKMHGDFGMSSPEIPLSIAAEYQQPELIQALLDDGHFDNHENSRLRKKALANAAFILAGKNGQGATQGLEILFRHGVSPDTRKPGDFSPSVPLIGEAARRGCIDTLELLKEAGADIHQRTRESVAGIKAESIEGTALHEAVNLACVSGTRWCLRNGLDPDAPSSTEKDRLNITALMMIAEDYGQDDEETDADFRTICKMLLEHGASPQASNGIGETALDYMRKHPDLIQVMDDFFSNQQEDSLLAHRPEISDRPKTAAPDSL